MTLQVEGGRAGRKLALQQVQLKAWVPGSSTTFTYRWASQGRTLSNDAIVLDVSSGMCMTISSH